MFCCWTIYSFDYALLREISVRLKTLVDATAQFCAQLFRIGILTDPVLQVGLVIPYVYVVCLFIAFILRAVIRESIDLVGRTNFYG